MRVSFVSLCVLLAFTTAFSQSVSPASQPTPGDDLHLFLKLTGHTFTSPLRWHGRDWLLAGSVVAGTGAASLLDQEWYDMMARNQTSFNTGLSDVVVEYGSGYTAVGLTGGFYLAGRLFKNSWLRETGILMASALAVSVSTETALKVIVGRARPYTGLGRGTFKPFNGKPDFLSFPSGHTTAAFTVSTVLAARINNTWASIGLYTLATSVAVSRMYSRDHWFSDVVFAGALSTFVGHSVVRWYEDGMPEEDCTTGLRVIPAMNGVTVVWRF